MGDASKGDRVKGGRIEATTMTMQGGVSAKDIWRREEDGHYEDGFWG